MQFDGYWLTFEEPKAAADKAALLALCEDELGVDPGWVDFADGIGRYYADGEYWLEHDQAVRDFLREHGLAYISNLEFAKTFWRPGFDEEIVVEFAFFAGGLRPVAPESAAVSALAAFESDVLCY